MNSLLSSQSKIFPFILLLTGAFSAADYFLTMTVLSQSSGWVEANPIANMLIHASLYREMKLIVVPLLLFFVWVCRKYIGRKMVSLIWFVFLVYALLIVYFVAIFFDFFYH